MEEEENAVGVGGEAARARERGAVGAGREAEAVCMSAEGEGGVRWGQGAVEHAASRRRRVGGHVGACLCAAHAWRLAQQEQSRRRERRRDRGRRERVKGGRAVTRNPGTHC